MTEDEMQATAPASSSLTAPVPAVYLPPTSAPPPPDLPDEAYDLTPSEAQSVLAGIAKRAKDDSVLRTSRMRERDVAPVRRWNEAKIRIKFPDRTIVQQTFPSSAPLTAVYAFVREQALDDAHASRGFTLYIPPSQLLPENPPPPPPRSKLPPSKRHLPPPPPKFTLAEHELAPSSVLSIRFDDASLNRPDARAPLRAGLLDRAEELPVPAVPAAGGPSKEVAKPTVAATGEGGKAAGGGKMPKWFKGPGKK